MEERKVAERRCRNLLKKSIPHIDVDRTDVFERLGFTYVKKFEKNGRKQQQGSPINPRTRLMREKYLCPNESTICKHLHKLPAVGTSCMINLTDTMKKAPAPSRPTLLERLIRDRSSIREREKEGKMTHKSSDCYL